MRSRLQSYSRLSFSHRPVAGPDIQIQTKFILAEDQQAREKVSPPFSFRPLVFPDHAQFQPEFRRREHRLVARRQPGPFVFHLGPQALRQSQAAFRLAQPHVLCHGSRMEPRP